jgi:hypothetical protein
MRVQTRFALDMALLTALIAAYRPDWTGVPVHQWLSIAIIVPLLVHGVVNWEWTAKLLRKLFQRLSRMPRINLVIDAALFLSAVCAMLSGFMVSPELLAPFGLHPGQPLLWHNVHGWSADATIIALVVHGAAHWRWLQSAAAKLAGVSTPGPAMQAISSAGDVSVLSRRRAPRSATVRGASRIGSRAAQAATERATARRTFSVIGMTAIAGLAVFAGVTLASPLLPASAQASARVADKGVKVCPSTGCAASKCHAEYGKSAADFYASTGAKKKTRRKRTKVASALRVALRSASTTLEPMAPPAPAPAPAKPAVAKTAARPSTAAKARTAATSSRRHMARLMRCPATGCSRSSCHDSHGQSASAWYRNH